MFDLLTPSALATAVEEGVLDYRHIVELINSEEDKKETEK